MILQCILKSHPFPLGALTNCHEQILTESINFCQPNNKGFLIHSTDSIPLDIYPASHECFGYRLSFVYQTQLKHELHASANARLQGGGN